jgi:alpha-amylase/alpha-mannosidase (GH57 family)
VTPTTLAVHAHFYQPPRENPWTEEVQREPSAAPFHDWNTRISAECYRPNAFARIMDGEGRMLAVVNNYEHLSFNVGPTLMSWLERHQAEVYARIREAQAAGGGAIAQAWNHMILPLANERDVRTQVRWGLADFRHRFGTDAPGMWLPETAVNDDVLQVLAEEGVGFTILAPGQARAVRSLSARGQWKDVDPDSLDTRVPYRWVSPAGDGGGVDLVFYDGPLSHDLAFSDLPSEVLVDRATAAGGRRGGLVTVALDGETFGHHHKWAERGVAYALTREGPRRGLAVDNLAGWLARQRPRHEAAVRESAWSCAHGVGRWATDCGCSTGAEEGSHQRWRAPLRAALDLLRDAGAEIFERRGAEVFTDDPWTVRDAYVDVLIGATSPDDFAARWVSGRGPVGDERRVVAFSLLEAQRQAMLMYTSCGWFFHDLAGLETVQVLRYAARAMDLLTELGETPPAGEFLAMLEKAESLHHGDGRHVWERLVLPARVDAPRVAAHLVLGDLFGLAAPEADLGCFDLEDLGGGKARRPGSTTPGTLLTPEADELGLAWRRVRLTQRRTGRTEELVAVALRLGDTDAAGAVRPAVWPNDAMALDALRRAMESGIPDAELAHRLSKALGIDSGRARSFDTSAMLPEAAETLLERVADQLADHLAAAAEPFLVAAHWAGLTDPGDAQAPVAGLPPALQAPAEAAVAQRLEHHLEAGELAEAVALAGRARHVGLSVEHAAGPGPAAAVGRTILRAVRIAVVEPGEAPGAALAALRLAETLGIHPQVEEAQELVFDALSAGNRPDLEPLAAALGISPDVAR